MKLFDIYDSWGNRIGEIREYDPDIGLGCFGSVFATFLGVIAPVAVWYAWYKVSFSEWSSETDRLLGIISMALMMATVILYGVLQYSKSHFSFAETLGKLILSITFIDGTLMWLIECTLEGEEYRFSYLMGLLFIFFLMSLGMGFGGATGIALSRRIFKK
ncbi:MAG: hypothetical protein IJ001_09535 [Oscillospiraceae bacterium]|nr:hypothetical protein [Oscillospiraceae bacterium]